MLFGYVTGHNRLFEAIARNNWTKPGAGKRQGTEEIGLQRDSDDVNTTTELPPGSQVPENATEPFMLGELPVSGLAFDLIFGAETGLNLASDIMMLVALKSWKTPETKRKLQLFLGWNCCTTGVCYIVSLFLADFHSRVFPYDRKGNTDITEERYRSLLKVFGIISYTVVLLVKVGILGSIYMFYSNWENLVKEDDTNQQGFPGYYPGAVPGAYPWAPPGAYPGAPPGAYPGAPPGAFPGPGGGPYPVQYYPGQYYQPPPQGAPIAPPYGMPPTKDDETR